MMRGLRRRLELVGRRVRAEPLEVDVLYLGRDMSNNYAGEPGVESYRVTYHVDGRVSRRLLTAAERKEASDGAGSDRPD